MTAPLALMLHGTAKASCRFQSARRFATGAPQGSMPQAVVHAAASLARWESFQRLALATARRPVLLGTSRTTGLLACEAALSAVQGTSQMERHLARFARQDFLQM